MADEYDPAKAGALFLQVAEGAQNLIDAAAGHRERCEAAGFSPTAAEAMAIDFHAALARMVYAPKPA